VSFVELDAYLIDCIKTKKIPGCVCWIGDSNQAFFLKAYGFAQTIEQTIPMQKDTIFDLASLTKPLATALAIMKLVECGYINLKDRVEEYLAEFRDTKNGSCTVGSLLAHTAGLPAWFPLYILPAKDRTKYLANTNNNSSGVEYSCLGYIILGMIVEWLAGCSLASFCATNIFKKAELSSTCFNPKDKSKIAATERGNEHEKEKAALYGDIKPVKWRDYLIKGEVHDGNSFYVYNGISGNAGLFSNVFDLAKLIQFYCQGKILSMETVKIMVQNHTGEREKRGLGWIIDPFPAVLSRHSFYHTGFTGTMCCIDPAKDLIIILLANAVHPEVRLGIMDPIRAQVVRLATLT
jgi:CubicO group peptidase (beta-lactamase class C family)